LESVFKVPYEKLFDPVHNSELFPSAKVHPETEEIILSPNPIILKLSPWKDVGHFFQEAAQFSDPVQGALADCYFISSLSAVAWSRPYIIAQKTRSTGVSDNTFVDLITFINKGQKLMVELDETLVVDSNSNLVYARSNDPGELWPGLYEKAFAMTDRATANPTTTQPDLTTLNYGDTMGALVSLTGLTPTSWGTASLTSDQIYAKILAYCEGGKKTFNPMVAWTYSSSPNPSVVYEGANVVANHAYTILGVDVINNVKSVVVRNPWGVNAPDKLIEGGTWVEFDVSYTRKGIKVGSGWWRSVPLATQDGVFALDAAVFKAYYQGFGMVSN